MPATAVTQFFIEAKPLWVGKVGASGVATAVVETIPADSAAGLTEGNVYIVTANRVNASGTTKNPASQRETFIGKLIGTNFTSCVRQVEGVAQAWESGIVLEVLFTATHWNKLIEGLEVSFNPDGTIKSSVGTALISTNKASGEEVDTGTDDTKMVTPKGIGDSNITTATKIQTLTNKTIVQLSAAYNPVGAGTTVIDLSAGGVHVVTMPADTQTLAISNATVGQCFIIEINNVTSQGALTWFSTIKWADGTAPTLTGVNGKKDTFGFRVTGTDTYDGYIVGQNI